MDPTPGAVTPEALVTKLKSQGFFDKVRKKCLECVESEKEYHQLLENVDSLVSRFLQRQPWPPRLGRLELRERLRRELCSSPFLQQTISLISAALVKAQPSETLRPSIERVVCESVGVDYQKWLARREAKTKADFSTLPPVLPTLVPPPLSFQAPDATLPVLTSSTVPQPTQFPFMPANFCQLPPPIHQITNQPALQPHFTSQTLPTDAQIHIPGATVPPIPAVLPLRPNTTSEETTDASVPRKTSGTETNALIKDEELDVAGEELLQCDDSMDVESSESQVSPTKDKEDKEQDDSAYMPDEDITFLPPSNTESEQTPAARQVVWEGMKMELDDISDEEGANQFRSRRLPQPSPVESTAAAKGTLQAGAMSPLRRRLSTCRPSKRDSPPSQPDDRPNFCINLLSGRCPEPPLEKFSRALDSGYVGTGAGATSPSFSPRGSPNFKRSRESDRLRKNPSPEMGDFQGRCQRHWKNAPNRDSPPPARNFSPRHNLRLVNDEPHRAKRAPELESFPSRMNSRHRYEDNNFRPRAVSPSRRPYFRPYNRDVCRRPQQDHHRNRSPALRGQLHNNYESDRYSQQRSCSQRHSHRQNGSPPCGRSSVRQTHTLSSCSPSSSPRSFANATAASSASSASPSSQRHAASVLRPHRSSPSRHVSRPSAGDRFVARSSLPPSQSHRRRQASPHAVASPPSASSHHGEASVSDGRWRQSHRRSHVTFDSSPPSGSDCSIGQHGPRNLASSSTERHPSNKDRAHICRQSARGFDPSSR